MTEAKELAISGNHEPSTQAGVTPSKPAGLALFIKKHWIALSFLLLISGMLTHLVILPIISFLLYKPKEGDIIFQPLPMGALTATIEGATDSPFSHCGIITKNERGQWIVVEAFGRVQEISLRDFWLRGRQFRFAIYRFKKDVIDLQKLIDQTRTYLGTPYDVQYELDDEKLYCSELIYKAYQDLTGEPLGTLQQLGELNWRPYAKVIEAIEPGKPPLKREIISPQSLSEADELVRIWAYGI